jgi:hypothetical protein
MEQKLLDEQNIIRINLSALKFMEWLNTGEISDALAAA